MAQESLAQHARRAWKEHHEEALEAAKMLWSWCDEPMPRVPGMDTVIRLAIRMDVYQSIEIAAAREYCYRWSLALKSRTFGVPHLLGM